MPSFQAWKICTFNEFSFSYSQSCSFRNSDNCVKFQCLIFIKTTFTQPSNQSSDSWSPLAGHPEEMYRKTEQSVLPFFSFSPSSARLTTSLWRSDCRHAQVWTVKEVSAHFQSEKWPVWWHTRNWIMRYLGWSFFQIIRKLRIQRPNHWIVNESNLNTVAWFRIMRFSDD